MSQRTWWIGVFAALAFALSTSAASAHDGKHGRRARLSAPEGATATEAHGDVSLSETSFTVRVEDLPSGEYSVLVDDGAGTKTEVGKIAVVGENDDEDEDEDEDEDSVGDDSGDDTNDDTAGAGAGGSDDGEDDEDHEGGDDDDGEDHEDSHGTLRLEAPNLPFAVASGLDLGGRAVCLKDAAGNVVLSGNAPAAIVEKPSDEEAHCALAIPEGAANADATGEIEIEAGLDRLVIKVEIEHLAPATVYDLTLTNPVDSTSEALGKITTGDDGAGRFKIDSAKGDAIPFGAASPEALLGFVLSVAGADGAVVLSGAVCAASVDDNGDDHGDDGDDGDEVGDDHGDDHGDDGDEVGDDHGDDGDEVGDDHGDDGDEVGDDHGDDGDEVGDDHGDDGDEVGDDNGDDGDEVGDDNGVDGTEDPADDNGGGGALNLDPIFVLSGNFDAAFLRGDSNADAQIDISDAVGILSYLFAGGVRPFCLDSADSNDDGVVDLSDSIHLLSHLFLGGAAPSAPGTLIPGSDPTADGLFCSESP